MTKQLRSLLTYTIGHASKLDTTLTFLIDTELYYPIQLGLD